MFDENSLSLDAFSDDAWLFLLEVQYFDLSGKQRIYVRSVLESVYTSTETKQIISVAVRNAISVLDAAIAVRVNTDQLQIIVAEARKRSAPKPATEKAPKQAKERINKPAYVSTKQQTMYAQSGETNVFAESSTQNLVAMTASKPLFIHIRTKE